MMTRIKNIDRKFLISVMGAPVMVGIIMLIVYMVKGVYPFGSGDIAYYDMGQSMVPIYYHTYDVLHGTKSLLWDWYSGGGVSMIDSAGNFVLSPFNLFFLFVKRDMIMQSMSLFLMLKVCVCAGTMAFYSRCAYSKLECHWHIIAGALYASSGFILQYYSNIQFLDMVALFPLIMHFTNKLIQERKCIGFCLTMAAGLIINMHFMIMVCIYLVIYCAGRISKLDKDVRKSRIILLGCSVFIAVCLSAVILLPTIVALLESSRVAVAQDFMTEYIYQATYDDFFRHKMFMLYGCELPLGALIVFLLFKRKSIKNILSELYLIILMVIPIFIELVNYSWHVGGYMHFPMRFGYMLTFSSLLLMGEILQTEEGEISEKYSSIVNLLRNRLNIGAIITVPVTLMILYFFMKSFLMNGCREYVGYDQYQATFATLIGVYVITFTASKKKIVNTVCCIVVFLQVGLGWYGFVAPTLDQPYENAEVIIDDVQRIGEALGSSKSDVTNRVKDNTVSFNSNYPFIMEAASISNWTWGGSSQVREVSYKLGYSEMYTRILDNGGTLFSDALFNVRKVISYNQLDKRIYELDTKVDEYYINNTKFNYPFGLIVSENMYDWTDDSYESDLEYQNTLFKSINSNNKDLMDIYKCEEVLVSKESFKVENAMTFEETLEDEKLYRYNFEIPIENECVLYLEPNYYVQQSKEYHKISINGQPLKIASVGNATNQAYPVLFVNGMLNCGVFEDETVECVIECRHPLEDDVLFGLMDITLLKESMSKQNAISRDITVDKDSLHMKLNNTSGEYLLLPMAYNSSHNVRVNGKKVTPQATIDKSLMLIPLEEGENVIDISFETKGLKLGFIITLFGLLCGALFLRFGNNLENNTIIKNVMGFLFMICEKFFIAYIYILPTIISVLVWTGILK